MLAAAIIIVGWLLVSIIFLPIYHGLKMVMDGVAAAIRKGVVALFQQAMKYGREIAKSFEAIALPDQMNSLKLSALQISAQLSGEPSVPHAPGEPIDGCETRPQNAKRG